MSADLHVDDRAGGPGTAVEPRDRRRPNVSGDLPTVFETGTMFRRALAGYDRFQVDTYVQWAEDELATADREREDLEVRHLATRAALEEARELLSHSSGGAEFVRHSERIGSMLAAAADEAEEAEEAEDEKPAKAANEKSAKKADADAE